MNVADVKILVLSDMPIEAQQVVSLLADDFAHVSSSIDESRFISDFDACLPDILVLAFRQLEQAERCCLGLYRHSERAHLRSLRSIVLCDKDHVRRAFELCRKEYFDDYVLYWPLVHDSTRLPMSILTAARSLTHSSQRHASEELLAQARTVARLDEVLEPRLDAGQAQLAGLAAQLDSASQAANALVDHFELDLDGVPSGFASGDTAPEQPLHAPPPAPIEPVFTIPAAQPLPAQSQPQPIPHPAFAIRKHVDAAAKRVVPLTEWVGSLRKEVSPQLDAARKLRDIAERTPPLVLVVDDDSFQCKLLGKLLEGHACRLLFAHTGAEAFSLLSRQRPDLILMDVQLPDADGVSLTRRIKAHPVLSSVPVVMITGHSERAILEASLQAGAADFVVKPFERDKLLSKLVRFLPAGGR